MMHRPATFIIIEPVASYAPLGSRFSKALGVVRNDSSFVLPHPEVAVHPGGTSPQSIIYALGHNERQLSHLVQLTPAIVRQLRGTLYNARSTKSAIHLFGLVDNQSPYGSRRALEAAVRALSPSGVSLIVHAGVWHPTPREFRHGVREIQSLCIGNITLGSLFPITSALHLASGQKFLDGILHPEPKSERGQLSLPLERPVYFSESESSPDDSFIFVNHALHGLDVLEELLGNLAPDRVSHLTYDHPMDSTISRALDKSNHIMAVTNAPSHSEAFFGSVPNHPYFESYTTHSSSEALEMLISPHFGYHQRPFRTVVMLREERRNEFDWLLCSYLKSIQSSPYYLCFLQPHEISGSPLYSNMPLAGSESLYRRLHHYV